MKKEINKIIDNLDKCMGVFDYMLTPTESNLLSSYIKELREKNKYLEKTIQKQKEITDKAIEYIKKAQLGELPNGAIYWLKDDEVGEKLLQILEDKEV